MLQITATIAIDETEIDWQAIRASGPGGQHVNKTSTAIQLMFDIQRSSLPEHYKTALLQKSDHRITASPHQAKLSSNASKAAARK